MSVHHALVFVQVLRTFLHLQLHSAEGPTEGNQGNKKESKMTNKQRKRLERQRMSRKERKVSKKKLDKLAHFLIIEVCLLAK